MNKLPDKDLFRVDEVASYFGFSRSKVYSLIGEGLLVAEKYTRSIRISREAIVNFRLTNQIDPLK